MKLKIKIKIKLKYIVMVVDRSKGKREEMNHLYINNQFLILRK